jgi:hypothetical protein
MSHGPSACSTETVNVFRERLNALYTLCIQVAAQKGAQTDRDVSVQEPFNAQMSTDGRAELPVLRMTKGGVEVTLHPAEISSDMRGGYYATLSVGRKLLGAGRLDSPSCWTDVDDPADPHWYAGALRDESKPVDAAMIRSWLHHGGPTPPW